MYLTLPIIECALRGVGQPSWLRLTMCTLWLVGFMINCICIKGMVVISNLPLLYTKLFWNNRTSANYLVI